MGILYCMANSLRSERHSVAYNTRNTLKPSSQPLYICGPTASGKSSHALTLARELDGEIVIGDLAGEADASKRDAATAGACVACVPHADVVRVHDVRTAVQALKVAGAILR